MRRAGGPEAMRRFGLQETVDFVVDCAGNENSDTFIWHPLLILKPDENDPDIRLTWDAKKDFSEPEFMPDPLTPWEKFAQVLLETNEFVFVD